MKTKTLVIIFTLCSMKAMSQYFNYSEQDYYDMSGVYSGIDFQNMEDTKPIHPEGKLKDKYVQNKHYKAFETDIQIPNTASMQLRFGDNNLGKNSFIFIQSLNNENSYQYMDSISLVHYNNSAAFFNTDLLHVELYVEQNDKNIFFEINKVVYIDTLDRIPTLKSICNNTDNRSRTNPVDPAIGRLTTPSLSGGLCTAWIVSNGALLTAGHCASFILNSGYTVVEFNIPDSDPNGNVNHPTSPNDIYPINTASVNWQHDGDLGDDWCVFTCFPNSTTGLTPIQGQNSFYRMSRDHDPDEFRITGNGTDDGIDNRTQQTATGENKKEVYKNANKVYWKYKVDTETGNSGSPIIVLGTATTVGIHTTGGCNYPLGRNKGTSFESDDLEEAIHEVLGTQENLFYVDNSDIVSNEDGSIFRPYSTVSAAVSAIPSGGTLSIVSGDYNETLTINKAIRILPPPTGSVRIGPGLSSLSSSIIEPSSVYNTNETTIIIEAPNNENMLYYDPDEEYQGDTEELTSTSDNGLLDDFIITPNPFMSNFRIETSNTQISSVRIINVTGKVVKEWENINLDNGEIQFCGNELNQGLYILSINTDKGIITKKILKQ